MRAWILTSLSLLTACSSLWTPSDEASKETLASSAKSSPAPLTPPPLNAPEFELRLAKLWGRVDELENHLIRQRERMKLLEKGLLLGIVPEELKNEKGEANLAHAKPISAHDELPASIKATGTDAETPKSAATTQNHSEKSHDIAEYRRLLQNAQEKFNAANYGQAIVHFNEIGDRFDDSITEGNHNYWIALSWFYLKEYQISEPIFRKFIEKYGQNPWVSYSRFYIAKIDLLRGLTGRAREQFKLLIDEYPNQDLSEMARMEIDKMREKL